MIRPISSSLSPPYNRFVPRFVVCYTSSMPVDIAQEEVCRRYNAAFSQVNADEIVGVSGTLDSSLKPINGLRHSRHAQTSGWYIWAGDYSEDKNFFKPMHANHVLEKYPHLAPYLGLPPGWRFQIDPDQAYEDVWHDASLLADE